MGSNADLDAILAADEEGRARIAAAERRGREGLETLRADDERRRRERADAEVRALDEELARLREATERDCAERERRRAAWRDARRRAAEAALDRAARAFAQIVRDGAAEEA